MSKNDKKKTPANLANNKKAFHDYLVKEKLEAGIELRGSEVKSCRNHQISLQEAYAQVKNDEIFLVNCHINPYEKSSHFNHEPRRERKLLLHRQEITRLKKMVDQKGLTLIPLSAYLKNGKVKISIGVCQGKNKGDKRESLKKAEVDRSIKRIMRTRQK